MCPSYLEVGKTGSQLFRARQTLLQLFGDRKKWIPAIRRPKNVVHNCQEQGKRLRYLFKVRKTGASQQEHEKKFPSYVEVGKTGSQLFRARQTLLQLFGDRKKWIPAIWRSKNVVHNCQEQGKRLTSI